MQGLVVSATHEVAPTEGAAKTSITTLMSMAVERGMDPAGLEKLFALYERDQAIQAQRAYANAMAEFQHAAPVIEKNRTVDTGKYAYAYAELDHIAETLRDLLHEHGLSYRFDSQVDAGSVAVKCIVSHRDGHSESTKFACPTHGMAGANAAQQTASALSYARRYALLLALGLTTGDKDDDAQGGPVTTEQVGILSKLLTESGVDKFKFLDWLGVGAIEDIPAAKFSQARSQLKLRVKK
jgi:hypothetical protein